jgi:hypothetical protein
MVRLCSLADEITRSRAIASAEAEFFGILLGIVHETVGMTQPVEAFYCLVEQAQKDPPVAIVFKDGPPNVAPGSVFGVRRSRG